LEVSELQTSVYWCFESVVGVPRAFKVGLQVLLVEVGDGGRDDASRVLNDEVSVFVWLLCLRSRTQLVEL
jgi:hypothetical protein